ncbi:M48 family metalloprotease [Wenzhouxiangella marina]|uniref:Peptidase M48 n=1 Tax=Wenzhouxiangella marina TaxID=1579979 RepID=A0A0K0XYS9_9GAMM|nr:M48 family metalloprotease [Wenzhouxiangella marina]AKS42830.1 peptidase M48 [Wenzhouxiangella marina]MBB6087490.1 putative Zn-dependent protease [Wenzhouxiangella marina]
MRLVIAIFALLSAAGCAVNPVTGQNELSLYDETWELKTGEQFYAPLRQQQGGDFVLDAELVDYVQEVGQRVAGHADRDLPYEFEVLNSSIPNAWALPGGKISINRGLLTEMNSEAELAAVLGHEVVHAAARHGASAQSRAALLQGAVVLGGVAVGVATEREDYAAVAMMGGMLGAQLIGQRYSRDAERESDFYGTRYMHEAGYNPEGAVRLQESFVRLSEGRDSNWLDGLFASHPPSPERVENNRRIADELGRTGILGEERYRQKTARLRALVPAYEAHDEGRAALAEGNHELALSKAEEALSLEDREAIFHALRGDALASAERWRDAERAYDRALALDQGWFYQHLRRGMVRAELGELEGARRDLEASLERLRTAQGHYYLGAVERDSGNRQRAIEQFRIAAQEEGEIGQRARQALNDMGITP